MEENNIFNKFFKYQIIWKRFLVSYIEGEHPSLPLKNTKNNVRNPDVDVCLFLAC